MVDVEVLQHIRTEGPFKIHLLGPKNNLAMHF